MGDRGHGGRSFVTRRLAKWQFHLVKSHAILIDRLMASLDSCFRIQAQLGLLPKADIDLKMDPNLDLDLDIGPNLDLDPVPCSTAHELKRCSHAACLHFNNHLVRCGILEIACGQTVIWFGRIFFLILRLVLDKETLMDLRRRLYVGCVDFFWNGRAPLDSKWW